MDNNKNQNNAPTTEKSAQQTAPRQGGQKHNRYNRHRRPRDNREPQNNAAQPENPQEAAQGAPSVKREPTEEGVVERQNAPRQNKNRPANRYPRQGRPSEGADAAQPDETAEARDAEPRVNNRRDNQRNNQRDNQRDAQRDAQRDNQRDAQRDNQRDAQRDAQREGRRDNQRGNNNRRDNNQRPARRDTSPRDTQRDTQRETQRDTQRSAQRDTQRDTQRSAQRDVTDTARASRQPRSAGRPTNYSRERELGDELAPEVIFFSAPAEIPAPAPGVSVKVGDPDLSAFDFDTPTPIEVEAAATEAVEVIGVRFRKSTKVYYFSPGNIIMEQGDCVIVETARGPEFGEVSIPNRRVAEKDIVQPLRPMLRPATPEDIARNEQNRQKEKDAFVLCQEKIAKHGLDMKLVDAQYTFDNSKLLFYFTSAGRVDFRELVKDLASVFRTRIELRQIGIRDEAKLLGGLGACGRPLCCAGFLSDFVQVSIKMAKEQNLSLNSNKISGACGRLMCCLRYENDTYEAELRLTPPVDSHVHTPEGNGVVTEVNPLAGTIKVKIVDAAKQETVVKLFHRDDVTVLSRGRTQDDTSDTAESNE